MFWCCYFHFLGTEAIGKAICVIAHEVKNFRENSREEQLLNLENSQGSAFKYSENVIICDTLINLHNADLEILDNFFGKVYRGVTGKELENTVSTKQNQSFFFLSSDLLICFTTRS